MLEKLIAQCVNRRIVTVVIALAIGVYGIHSFRKTPIEAFPDVTNLQVNVITTAPGLAPEEVERQITIPLERALNGVPEMTLMRSESLFGLSLIWLIFDDNADSFVARARVQERLHNVELPEHVQAELAPDYTPLGKVLYYRLLSDRHDLAELRTWQELTVSRVLKRTQGVADVIGFGGYMKEFHVEADPLRLATHGLTISALVEALDNSNLNVAGGFLRLGEQELVIRSLGAIRDADDIRAVVLYTEDGVSVTVGDVATIVQSHTPRRGAVGLDELDDIVQGIVLLRRGENPNDVLARVRSEIENLNENILPTGMEIDILYDRGSLVGKTVQTVYTNLWHGLVLILGVVWLFIRSVRGSLIVVSVIPLSLLAAFIGLYHLGLPANLISMGAIDFGILVDGAVVLVENVVHAQREKTPRSRREMLKLVVSAAIDVARPTIYAMAIIIAALAPVLALESVEGRIFRPLALTYGFALIGALVFAFTVVPALCAIFMKPGATIGQDPHFIVTMRNTYRLVLRKVLRSRYLAGAAALVFLGSTFHPASQLGSEFLPSLDEGDIYIFTELPPSVSFEDAQRWMSEIRHALRQYPEVASVVSEQGRPEDGTDNEGVNMAKLFVRLHPTENWPDARSKDELIAAIRADLGQFPGIRFNFSQPIKDSVEEAVSGVRGQVVLKVYGPDLDIMRNVLTEALEALSPVEGIVDLDLYRDAIVPQLQIRLNRQTLARHGILVEDAQRLIETALAGRIASVVWEGEQRVPIRVRLPPSERRDVETIGNLLVSTPSGAQVPLRHLAEIETATGRTSIPREDNSRYLALKFNVAGRDTGSVIRDAMDRVAEHVQVPEGHFLQWGGEFENQERASQKLATIVPIALLLVLALLYSALGSIRAAASIFLVAPFGMTGGIYALYFVGVELSVSAIIGFIALIGQISLLGLLQLSAIEKYRAEGFDRTEAIIAGATTRFRALLLTALLASLGLLPMATSTGMGSETQRPFALALVGGMLTTLLFSLFLLPVIYSFFAGTGTRSDVVVPSSQEIPPP